MATRPLNPARVSPATAALYDLMADGTWHANADLIAAAADVFATQDPEKARENGRRVRRKGIKGNLDVSDADLITSGAKDHVRNLLMIGVRTARIERSEHGHRLAAETIEVWNNRDRVAPAPTPRPLTLVTRTHVDDGQDGPRATGTDSADGTAHDTDTDTGTGEDTGATTGRGRRRRDVTLMFNNTAENDGFAAAPLVLGSLVHFRTSFLAIPLEEFRADLPAGCDVTFSDSEGLYRVGCPHGTGSELVAFITEWCAARDITTVSLRAEDEAWRRNIRDLDPYFLSDLCNHYEQYARGRLKRHTSTLQFHFSDSDDLTQQIFEWVLEAVSRYDDTKSVPFGAFLSTRLSNWVHNLNRSKYGRPATDAEIAHQRVRQTFVTENGRQPTEREMADALGQSLPAYRKNATIVATLQGFRNIQTIDTPDGVADFGLTDDTTAEDRIMENERTSLLSQVLTAACEPDQEARTRKAKENPNILGWAAMYETLWGGKNKTETSNRFGTSIRNMNIHSERVEERMRTRSDDLSAH